MGDSGLQAMGEPCRVLSGLRGEQGGKGLLSPPPRVRALAPVELQIGWLPGGPGSALSARSSRRNSAFPMGTSLNFSLGNYAKFRNWPLPYTSIACGSARSRVAAGSPRASGKYSTNVLLSSDDQGGPVGLI